MIKEKMPSEGTAFQELGENVKEVKDDMKEAIKDDRPLDKHAAGATFSLIFLSYMVGLFLFICVVGLIYWLFF